MPTLDKINSALEFISSDERETWLKVGMALHNEDVSFSVWEDWSKKSSKYDSKACYDTWKSFKKGRGITVATVFDLARKAGWKPNETQQIQQTPEEKALSIWQMALPVDTHPYLITKRIKPYIARQYKGSLIVPLYDIDGKIRNIQFINETGEKKFLKGSKKTGLFFEASYYSSCIFMAGAQIVTF